MTGAEARRALVDYGRRLQTEGLVARSWGNLSVRLDETTMAVTPSGIPWADLTEAMIVEVNLETGEWSGPWKPSGERKVHRAIYLQRPEVGAVAHTHQSAASVCAAARVSVVLDGQTIPCAPYGLPGTKTLTRGTVEALAGGPAVLLANHGVFTVGADLDEAFLRIRRLETACADLVHSPILPTRTDTPWDPRWLRALDPQPGREAWLSTAPFTVQWSRRNQPLRALLDDLAQLAGPWVPPVRQIPKHLAKDVVLVRGQGALVAGPDAEALAMVVEKGARAALGAEGLGGAHAFPAWEAWLMRLVYAQSYAKQAKLK